MNKFLSLVILIIFLFGCTNKSEEEVALDNTNLSAELIGQYENAQTRALATLRNACKVNLPTTRNTLTATTLPEIIESLISISQENHLDSFPARMEVRNELDVEIAVENIINTILNEEERIVIDSFLSDYMDLPHSDFQFIQHYIINQTHFVQLFIVRAAAIIDLMRSYETRANAEYCLRQLKWDLCYVLVDYDAADLLLDIAAATPGIDLVAAAIEAGIDSITLLELADKYNKCLRGF